MEHRRQVKTVPVVTEGKGILTIVGDLMTTSIRVKGNERDQEVTVHPTWIQPLDLSPKEWAVNVVEEVDLVVASKEEEWVLVDVVVAVNIFWPDSASSS